MQCPFSFFPSLMFTKHKTIQNASPNQTKKPAAAIIIAVLLLEKPIFIWLLVYFFCARETKKWWRALHFSHKQQIKIIHIFTHITFAVYIVSYRNSTLHTHTTTTTTTTAVPWWTKDMSSLCPCRTVNDDTTSKKGKGDPIGIIW